MHLVVQWPRFGPYHLARLRATHARWSSQGRRFTALEVASQDAVYDWELEQASEPFERVCALPGKTLEAVPPAQVQRAMARTLTTLDPDAVAITSYSTPGAQSALRWCRRHRRAAVLMLATQADDAVRTPWRERIKASLIQSYDAALVGGTPQRAYLHQLGFPAERIFQPYNAVDNAFFAEGAAAARRDRAATASRLGLPSSGPFVLCICRLLAHKNVDGLLRAYDAYARAAPEPWPLVLVGDGPERERLEALAAGLGTERVHFAGFRQKDDLGGFYGLAGTLVLPSFREPWGLVVNEAMAAGLPVLVSTKAGCHVDLVEPSQNGFTFDPHDNAGLVQALASLHTMDREAMGHRSREIVSGWSPAAFAAGMDQAVSAAASVSDRRFPTTSRAVLTGLRLATRHHRAFHSTSHV